MGLNTLSRWVELRFQWTHTGRDGPQVADESSRESRRVGLDRLTRCASGHCLGEWRKSKIRSGITPAFKDSWRMEGPVKEPKKEAVRDSSEQEGATARSQGAGEVVQHEQRCTLAGLTCDPGIQRKTSPGFQDLFLGLHMSQAAYQTLLHSFSLTPPKAEL